MSKARVVVLGSNGMLGHVLSQVLSEDPEFEVIRANRSPYPGELFFDGSRPTFLDAEPDYVVNCVGLLVNDSEKNPELAAWTNGHLPYMIAAACAKEKAKMIHISTDCVFRGDRGKYTVDDKPDATSIYGQTKALGEITNSPNHLTIRTSIIGPEIKMKGSGLFHWFMTQDKEVNGWSNVFWNGVTTLRLAQIIRDNLVNGPNGLIHVSSEDMSKYILLSLIGGIWNRPTHIIEKADTFSDKTLVASEGFYQGELLPQLEELHEFMAKNSYQYELQYGKEWM